MLQGQWILVGAEGTTVLFTEWFDRQQTNAVMTYEVVQLIGTPTLTVDVYHKNRDEVGNGAQVSVSWTTSNGMTYGDAENLEEMIRFKVSLEATASLAAGAAIEAAFLRILMPTWFDSPND
jgi:hypothetical protein